MKLARVGSPGDVRLVCEASDGTLRDLSSRFDAGETHWLTAMAKGHLAHLDPLTLPRARPGEPFAPCVPRPGKFLGVGLNYRDHVTEVGLPIPEEPTLFMKSPSSLCAASDPVRLPSGATMLDWEIELGVVIGKRARELSSGEAESCIAGYCAVIDFSERRHQLERGGQWMKGKSADTFGPAGPWLITKDEAHSLFPLKLWLSVNGVMKQSSTSLEMIWNAQELVAYISQFLTLEPGDLIATGTPAGVGHGSTPRAYLSPGDIVEAAIEGFGVQRHLVVAAADLDRGHPHSHAAPA